MKLLIANLILWVSTLKDALRWHVVSPQRHQLRLLHGVVDHSNDSRLLTWDGTYHHYKELVSISEYDDCQPSDDSYRRVPTSGTSSGTKTIAYTKALERDMRRGVNVWLFHLYRTYPRLFLSKMYWSVTPIAKGNDDFPEDGVYVSPFARRVLDTILVVPQHFQNIDDVQVSLYATARLLIQEPRLGFVSIWNPSFFRIILDLIQSKSSALLQGIQTGTWGMHDDHPILQENVGLLKSDPRRTEVSNLHGTWPRLQNFSSWGDAYAQKGFDELRTILPQATHVPKGLMATEGVFSLPVTNTDPCFAYTSHFVEFKDVETELCVMMSDVEVGKQYEIIPSLRNGYLRYRLGDIVQVTGWHKKVPTFRLIKRRGDVADLCGEKLSEEFVSSTVDQMVCSGIEYIITPNSSADGYVMYLCSSEVLCDVMVDGALRRGSFHYNYCRELGQLQQLRIVSANREKLEEIRSKSQSNMTPLSVSKSKRLISYSSLP